MYIDFTLGYELTIFIKQFPDWKTKSWNRCYDYFWLQSYCSRKWSEFHRLFSPLFPPSFFSGLFHRLFSPVFSTVFFNRLFCPVFSSVFLTVFFLPSFAPSFFSGLIHRPFSPVFSTVFFLRSFPPSFFPVFFHRLFHSLIFSPSDCQSLQASQTGKTCSIKTWKKVFILNL